MRILLLLQVVFSFTVRSFHSDSLIRVLYVNGWYKGTIQWYNSKMFPSRVENHIKLNEIERVEMIMGDWKGCTACFFDWKMYALKSIRIYKNSQSVVLCNILEIENFYTETKSKQENFLVNFSPIRETRSRNPNA